MTANPTVVLVHGAFAESASWNDVIDRLQAAGLRTIAVANPLRNLTDDADFLASLLRAVKDPTLVVGHSYGGAVMTDAAAGVNTVKALVFVAAFAPDQGESIAELSGKYPGSTLGDTLWPVTLADGSTDYYIRPEDYHRQFAADLSARDAARNATTQRPLRDAALNGTARTPAWRTIPSWFIYPELDRNIPPAVHRFMAERARSRETIEVPGASHTLPVSQPAAVSELILRAVTEVVV